MSLFFSKENSKRNLVNTSKTFEELRQKFEGTKFSHIKPRTKIRAIGEITSTRKVPRAGSHFYEVILKDETGKLVGWFFGKKNVAGLNLGNIVLFEGVVITDEGELTIANPYYEIIS